MATRRFEKPADLYRPEIEADVGSERDKCSLREGSSDGARVGKSYVERRDGWTRRAL